MTFLAWLFFGAATLLMYTAYRNLSVSCVVTHVLQGKSGDCKNKR